MEWEPSTDLYKGSEFADFRYCLDSEMKHLQNSGLGSQKRKAGPLSATEEDLLWKKGLHRDRNPQAQVDTIVVINSIYLALCSCLIHKIVNKLGHRSYLEYSDDMSKNRPGGVKGREMKPKVGHHYENPERCFVCHCALTLMSSKLNEPYQF